MNNSGDAAEQVLRMSLEGAEFALKITGAAAKNIAAMLYTVLTDQKKTKGKARVETMLRDKRPMTIYTVKKEDCPEFARQAKRYGIMYAPIPIKKKDADTIDIMVFEDDASRANRIVEKFELTAVNTASIKSEIEKTKESRGGEQAPPEQAVPEKSADDKLLDELLEKPAQKEKQQPENPAAEKTAPFQEAAEKSPPSAPTSGSRATSAKGTSDTPKKSSPQRTSVRQELREIQSARKQETELPGREEQAAPGKKAAQKTSRHTQPKPKKKSKSKER